MSFIPTGPVQSPGTTYTETLGAPQKLDGIALTSGVTTISGFGEPRGTIGPATLDHTGLGGAVTWSGVVLQSASFPSQTRWRQDVQGRVLAKGPHLYEPTAEFAATDPTVVGWAYPGSGVMHIDRDRCYAFPDHAYEAYTDYNAWVTSGGSAAYDDYRRTHYQPLTSCVLDYYDNFGAFGFGSTPLTPPSWASSWTIGVPSGYTLVTTPSFDIAICLPAIDTSLGSSSTHATTQRIPQSSQHAFYQNLADWPLTNVTGFGDVYYWGYRLTTLPISSTDLLTTVPAPPGTPGYTDNYSVYMDATAAAPTATATKTPWQWLTYSAVVEPPVETGLLKVLVDPSGASEAARWDTWGFDNEGGTGVGKIRAGSGWHVADDDAATVSGQLKVLDHAGVWRHASWMTGS